MENWWIGTDRGKQRTHYWWNGIDRGKQNVEYCWNGTDWGKQNVEYVWNHSDPDKFLLQHKDQPINFIEGNNGCLLWELYGTRRPTVWRKWADCNVNVFTAGMQMV
jgi:hypothetical protein